jgi:hypothetical protein
MAKEQIGFIHGLPENPDKTWEKVINGKTFTFLKKRVGKNGVFLYNCAQYSNGSAASTGLYSERNLTHDEVEQLPRFVEFMAERS